jgi:quinoprotein glucose dehydrogenase
MQQGHRRSQSTYGFIVLALMGLGALALTIGGAWLLLLGGSPYYLLAGLLYLAAMVLLGVGRRGGAWIVAGVTLVTALWAWWETGGDGWGMLPRMTAPLLLALLIAFWLPRLRRTDGVSQAEAVALPAALVLAAVFWAAAFVTGSPNTRVPEGVAFAPTPGRADPPATQVSAEDWRAYGGTKAATRYSALSQITPENVGNLALAWEYHTGDLPGPDAENSYSPENTPLKVGDTIYVCSAMGIVAAVDPATGEERWRFDPQVAPEHIPYGATCRGVAYFDATAVRRGPGRDAAQAAPAGATPPAGDGQGAAADAAAAGTAPGSATTGETATAPGTAPAEAPPAPAPTPAALSPDAPCATSIIWGTLDARLLAIDARTGQPCADFGTDGAVNLLDGLGETVPGWYAMTSPPTIVNGVAVVGAQVKDGQAEDAPSGVIRGYDARTGALAWAWDMGAPDRTGAPPEGETYTRGTPNMWTIAAGDDDLGLVYLPLGNSSVDYYGSNRSAAENRYSTSLVALDAATGRVAWFFQTVHNDVWDYDLGSQPTLIDFAGPGGTVPAVILASKQGDIYILDRATGEPLTGVEERPVPQGGVEPDYLSPTQPFSLWHTLAKPDLTEADMWGITPFDQLYCRIRFRMARYDGIYTPPMAERYWIQYPGYNGGSDWGSLAVDPVRGVILANYNDMPNHNRLVPRAEADALGLRAINQPGGQEKTSLGEAGAQIGAPYAIDINAGWRVPFTGLLCKEPPYGGLRAIDLATGKTLWDRPFGTARRNGPWGIPSYLPAEIGTPNNGGSVVTASGLAFIAASTDNLFRAVDMATGETLWSVVLPAGGQANPFMYQVDGRQYVGIMAGGHHFMETPVGDSVLVWALP